MMQFSLELHAFLVGLVHDVAVLLQLVDLHLVLLQLVLTLLLLVLDLIFELIDDLIVVLLISLLQLRDLVLQPDGPLQLVIVLPLQLPLDLGPVDLRPVELLMQLPQLLLQLLDLGLLVIEEGLQLGGFTI